MTIKVLIVFDSRYGNTHTLAESVAEGASEVEGSDVWLRRVKIVEPEEIIQKHEHWARAHEKFSKIREVTLDEVKQCDALILGSPTRYGSMTAPLKAFVDSTGELWTKGALSGKVGAAFTSTSTAHGGNEFTIISMLVPLMHHGMVIVPTGYGIDATFEAGNPYGASSVSGPDAMQKATEAELTVARFLGRRVAETAKKLKVAAGAPVAR